MFRQLRLSSLAVALVAALVPASAVAQAASPSATSPERLGTGHWVVTSVLADSTLQALPADSAATLDVYPGGVAAGWTGCSTFAATAAIEGTSVRFGEPAATAASCDADTQARSAALFAALAATRSAEGSGGGISLKDADGNVVATLQGSAQPTVDEMRSLITETESLLSQTQEAIHSTNETLAKTNKVVNETQQTLNETNALLAETKKASEAATAKVGEAQGAIERRITEVEARLGGRLERIETRVSELRQHLGEVRGAIEGRIAGLRQHVSEVRAAIEARLEEIRDRIDGLQP